ncbi:MAG TPA: tryptophan--tRNA ligase [Candidatus Methanofastidiosa archaeon]|nr:tryptophan--tRNA ligase [Candidatus Methanofastidiosa archaeon]
MIQVTDFKVTPWEVEGDIDYNKLIEQFGTQPITEDIVDKVERLVGEVHPFLRRKVFFSHRDFDWILSQYEKGIPFALYTGRGPSGQTHLGHVLPWIFTKYLQDRFGCELWFQLTDDEKFVLSPNLSIEDVDQFTYDNTLDIIAMGFDPERTKIISDLQNAKTLYRHAIRVAKKVTFSTAKAVFGFDNSTNIGLIFFTSMQSVPAFLPSIKSGKNIPVLIPCAIDQDPHFRITRDVAEKLGYYKPALIQSMFLPSLEGPDSKMSASKQNTAIFTVDSPKTAKKKVMNAFTGGCQSLAEQREKGGNPNICTIFQYLYILFEENDEDLEKRRQRCISGEEMCGNCKKYLAEKVAEFLRGHQERREKAKDMIDQFVISD